jgi:hypothetical protein
MGLQRQVRVRDTDVLQLMEWSAAFTQHSLQRSDRSGRRVVRFSLNVSRLEQTVRFLPNKVELFHLILSNDSRTLVCQEVHD